LDGVVRGDRFGGFVGGGWVLALFSWQAGGRWHSSHLVNLKLDLLDPSLEFLRADLRDSVMEGVQVPESIKSKVEHTGIQLKLFTVISHHVQDNTARFLTDKLTEGSVIGVLHCAHRVELEGHLQAVFEHLIELGGNLNRELLSLHLFVNVVVDETLDELGSQNLMGVINRGRHRCPALVLSQVLVGRLLCLGS